MTKEEFQVILDKIKGNLDETTGALVSEDFLAVLGAFNGLADESVSLNETIKALKSEKEELLKVNGKLYQKIGFDEVVEEKAPIIETEEEIVTIDEIIDEKGDFINE